jgi:hypothetical protein
MSSEFRMTSVFDADGGYASIDFDTCLFSLPFLSLSLSIYELKLNHLLKY